MDYLSLLDYVNFNMSVYLPEFGWRHGGEAVVGVLFLVGLVVQRTLLGPSGKKTWWQPGFGQHLDVRSKGPAHKAALHNRFYMHS